MAAMSSPYKSAVDSPSRQLLWELSRLGISNQEEFNARLDQEFHEREVKHRSEIAAAVAKHTQVRESAENARRELELNIEIERQKREDEERRELRKKEQEKAEGELLAKRAEAERGFLAQKAETERLEQAQLEQQKREREQASKDEEAARLQQEEKTRKDEVARRETEGKNLVARQQALERREAERKANEARIADEANRVVSSPASAPVKTTTHATHATGSILNSEREAEHQRFLAVHKNLKKLRAFVIAESKKNSELKQSIGDIRRQIRKSVGQLTTGQNANKTPLSNILEALRRAKELPSRPVDVSLFLANPPSSAPNGIEFSALLIYLLNLFAKYVISQFSSEASVDAKQADPIGTIASHVFAMPDFQWNETSFIDILLAKMHVVCPVLFGVWGNEATNEGKIRLGWGREEKGGPFVPEQSHNDRMSGFGAGFAALSLRNYEKAKFTNPYPAINYWRSFSYILNVPLDERTGTHCIVLKAMIENFEERFMMFFGDAALVALRCAVIDYPKGVKQGMGPRSLSGLADTMRKDKKLRLL